MRILSWIVLLPLALIVIALAVANRGTVTISLWPLPLDFAPQLWLLVMVFAGLGLLGGLLVGLNKSVRWQVRARRAEAEVARLEGALEHERASADGAGTMTPARPASALSGPPARAA